MRITLTIDDDTFAALSNLAQSRSRSLEETASDVLRKGLIPSPRQLEPNKEEEFPIFRVPPNAPPITPEDVKRLEDEP
jgi:hypothetical protein